MHYYPYFQYTGTYVLANALGATDPFELDPAEIVERVLSAGYTRVSDPRSEPLELSRLPYRIEHEGQTFLVYMSRSVETIAVGEIREDRYDPIE